VMFLQYHDASTGRGWKPALASDNSTSMISVIAVFFRK
jgi:hypothetical protein